MGYGILKIGAKGRSPAGLVPIFRHSGALPLPPANFNLSDVLKG
jgi:hypothetical protein